MRPNAWTDLTNHGASIIGISCISFQMPSPTCSCSNSQQASQFDQMLGRIYRTTGRASSASAAFPFRCPLRSAAVRIHSRRRSSTECLDGFNEPRGEHHQHQLHFLSDALSDLRCVRIHSRRRSSTECLDGFRRATGGEHHQHQLDFLLETSFRSCWLLEPTSRRQHFDRMLGRI